MNESEFIVGADELEEGCLLQNRSGDWHRVLKIERSQHVQSGFDGKWSTQNHNQQKEDVVTIWDGYRFTRRVSMSEVLKIYETARKSNWCPCLHNRKENE